MFKYLKIFPFHYTFMDGPPILVKEGIERITLTKGVDK
jgi:hypothetical protein